MRVAVSTEVSATPAEVSAVAQAATLVVLALACVALVGLWRAG
jgi:hypothetical protein